MSSVIFDCDLQQRDDFRNYLLSKGIDTRPLFYPIHTMPMYSHRYQSHKVAEDISRRGFNIPSYPDLEEHELEYICKTILEYNF